MNSDKLRHKLNHGSQSSPKVKTLATELAQFLHQIVLLALQHGILFFNLDCSPTHFVLIAFPAIFLRLVMIFLQELIQLKPWRLVYLQHQYLLNFNNLPFFPTLEYYVSGKFSNTWAVFVISLVLASVVEYLVSQK